jgi:hypothetical protein
MSKSRFEKRFIAFVDILGFANIVERMPKEDHLFANVRDALKYVVRQEREVRLYRREKREKTKEKVRQASLVPKTSLQMTAFSDCYVLSEVFPAWHVVAAVQALGSRFLTEGILTRGAIVLGDAYHSGRVLFGPGIVEAYRLEQEVAKYPRILVSEDVRKAVWGYHEGVWERHLLQQDVDGCWFINLLTPSLSSWGMLSTSSRAYDLEDHLNKVRSALADEWKRVQGDAAKMSKVWWMIHRFNQAAPEARVRAILK